MTDEQVNTVAPPLTGSVVFRLVWMGAAPAILLCIFVLTETDPWTFGGFDLAIAIIVAAAIGARAVDGLYLGGTTAYGEPSTRRHILAYAIKLVLITGAAWVLAQSIGV